MKIVFAGDRDISVRVLQFMLSQGVQPLALLVASSRKASHAKELISLCSYLDEESILPGKTFREEPGLARLRGLEPDYIIGIHFPYIVPQEVLEVPRIGFLNLHPAYLPFNRGWHTPSWAILEDTPYGATLHFMDEGVDTGAIVHQKRTLVAPEDTANSLYQKVKATEYEVFLEAWDSVLAGTPALNLQDLSEGTSHKPHELLSTEIQRIDLEEKVSVGDLLKKLRALTTNRVEEAAYYERNGIKYRIQVEIIAE